jgi:hypothetical protein
METGVSYSGRILMTTRPSGGRRVRRLGWLSDRVTFANVTALLALFVALGGSSYAAIRVGSEQIANNSIRSKDLYNNGVRGKDIRKGTIRGTDVHDGDLKGKDVRDDTLSGDDVKESSLGAVPNAALAANAANAAALGGKPASAFLGSDKQRRTGLIRLAEGQSRTVAAYGPFTWTANCAAGTGPLSRLTVSARTTEANSFAGSFNDNGSPLSPGAPAILFDSDDPNRNGPPTAPVYNIAFPLSAVAPSGAAPTGIAFAGIDVAGADCVVNGILWP